MSIMYQAGLQENNCSYLSYIIQQLVLKTFANIKKFCSISLSCNAFVSDDFLFIRKPGCILSQRMRKKAIRPRVNENIFELLREEC